jgi:hypothetical protein
LFAIFPEEGGCGHQVVKPQTEEIVGQLRPHEKLGGQITDNPGILLSEGRHSIDKQVLHAVPDGMSHGHIVIIQGGGDRQNSLGVKKVVGNPGGNNG